MILPYDRDVALRIATEVAWPVRHKTDSSVRLRAGILIGKIDHAQAVPTLDRLSKDPSMTGETRLHAAMHITKHGGPITALADLGNDPKLDRTYRVKAAEAVGKLEPAAGAQLYISIAKTCTPTDHSRLTLLREAYALDPGPAAEALAEVAETTRTPGPVRIEAVETASPTLCRRRSIDLYTTIATTADNDTALAAARKIVVMDNATGQQLMGRLAGRSSADTTFRLTTALEADIYGKPVLRQLAHTARPDTVRLKAAQGLYAIDKKAGEAALQKLVKKSWVGNVQIDAALTLPGTLAVNALITIAEDLHEKEAIRFDAAVKAKEKDEKRGRQALLNLANARRISNATREKVRQHLNR